MARAPGTETDARGADGGIMAVEEKVKSIEGGGRRRKDEDARGDWRSVSGAGGEDRCV